MDPDPSAAQATPEPAEPAPRLLGNRYQILGLLGAGGMGNVYKARDHTLDELCALKVLRREMLGEPELIERFRREVKLARRVTHPNVARVFDIGEPGGECILTMELIDGEPLSARIAREGALPVAALVEIASAICAGLEAAHAAGVIHRDLKPHNVLLEKGGRVVITDFGIARAAAAGSEVATAVLGTPVYMAPEQVEGTTMDARTDVYALGATLFEIATGRRPWGGETVIAVATARLHNPPPDPRAARPDLPAGLATLILRAMARRPEDRFQSAAEVASALAGLMIPEAAGGLPRTSSLPAPLSRAGVERHVAVLPFRNAGPPEQAYVAEGLTEDVIDQLSMVPGLRVRSRGVVMRYKNSDRDPREVGRELDVQVVVDGTVRRTGPTSQVGGHPQAPGTASGGVRISARMASVVDGVQLWARRFDRPDTELLQVSDDVARAIAEALAMETGAAPRVVEANPEALDLYLRGRAAYHTFFDNEERTALTLLEQALARAPNDPRILAGYAMARARVWSADPAAARAASEAAARAVELAPGSPHAQIALAAVAYQAGDEVGAVRSLRRALHLSPRHADVHDLLGRILSDAGLFPEARHHLTTALELEPDTTLARLALARMCELMGEPDEADRLADERPDDTWPLTARLVLWRRDAARAAEILGSRTLTGPGSGRSRALLDLALGGPPPYGTFGIVAGRATIRLALFFAQVETEIAAFVGHRPRALAALSRGAEGGLFDLAWMDGCPLLANFYAEPPFQAARAEVAARAERVIAAYREP